MKKPSVILAIKRTRRKTQRHCRRDREPAEQRHEHAVALVEARREVRKEEMVSAITTFPINCDHYYAVHMQSQRQKCASSVKIFDRSPNIFEF